MGFLVQGISVLRDAARLILVNLAEALKLSLTWTLCGLIPTVSLIYQSTHLPLDTPEQLSSLQAGQLVVSVVAFISIGFIAVSSIAVNWHRLILLNERPSGRNLLRVDGKVWRYLGNALLIAIVVGVITMLPLSKLASLMGGNIEGSFVTISIAPAGNDTLMEAMTPANYFLSIVADAAFGGLFFCLALKLPAVAVDRTDFGIGDSWRQSESHLGLNLCLAIVISFITQFASTITEMSTVPFMDAGILGAIVSEGIVASETFFFGFFGLTVLTVLYRHRVPQTPVLDTTNLLPPQIHE